MKYSLRSLMVGVTLFCVLLGGRIEYLRRWAAFHSRELSKAVQALEDQSEHGPNGERRFLKSPEDFQVIRRNYLYHQTMTERYEAALYRPWMLVKDEEPKL